MSGMEPALLGLVGGGLGSAAGSALGETALLGGLTGALNEGLGTFLTTQGVGSTLGRVAGSGLGTAAGSALAGGRHPGRAGLIGAAGGAVAPLVGDLASKSLSSVLGKNGSRPSAVGVPDFDQDSTEPIPVTPAAAKTSAGAALSALPPPNASPSSSRLAMLEELRRRFV